MGEGKRGLSSESPLPPSLHPSKTFPFIESPIRSFLHAQESLPHGNTFPDLAVFIKNARIHERIRASSLSHLTELPPGGLPTSRKSWEGKGRVRAALAGLGRERGSVGMLSPSPERLLFPPQFHSRILPLSQVAELPLLFLIAIQLIHDRIHKPLPAGLNDVVRHAHGHPCAVAVPPVPSEAERTRTLKSNSFISFKRG